MRSISRFSIGELVRHRLFNYRGVIVDVDHEFMLTEEWYEESARSRPPKDKPWYHVLVHDAPHNTYVAERNLESDPSGEPVSHPLVELEFAEFRDGRYLPADKAN